MGAEKFRGAIAPRLAFALGGNALQRIAAGASGVLVGLYLANLAGQGSGIGAALVGTLAAVSFGAELLGAIPLGVLADVQPPRRLVTFGALLGAAATQLFGVSRLAVVFFLSRTLEGFGSAAVTPPLLAHLTDATRQDASLRAKVMSYFELSLLGGIGFGGLVGAELWTRLHVRAFAAVAAVYVVAAALLCAGTPSRPGHRVYRPLESLAGALAQSSLRRLAPVWLCMNTIVGLWLGPTLSFLLTTGARPGRFLDGLFAAHPERVGWVLLGYVAVFGVGVVAWSFVLPRVTPRRTLRITLIAMLIVSVELLLLNRADSAAMRWLIGAAAAVSIMVESVNRRGV